MRHLLNTLFVNSEDIYLSLDGEKTVGLGGDWDGCDAFPKGVTGIESLPDFRDFLRERDGRRNYWTIFFPAICRG